MVGSRSSLLWKNFSRCGYLLFQHIHSACIPSASNGKQTTGDVVIKHVVILDAYSAEVKLFWCGDCAFDGTWVRQCSTFLTWNPALSLSKGIPPPDYFSMDSSPDFVVPNFFLQLTKYIRFGENSNSKSSSGFIAEVLQCHLFPATLLIFPPLQNILLRSRSTSKHPQRLRNSVHTFYQNWLCKRDPRHLMSDDWRPAQLPDTRSSMTVIVGPFSTLRPSFPLLVFHVVPISENQQMMTCKS